jgi:hypothetical protein
VKLVGKFGSIKKFYFAYQTEFVGKKKFATTHWLDGFGKSQSAIGR